MEHIFRNSVMYGFEGIMGRLINLTLGIESLVTFMTKTKSGSPRVEFFFVQHVSVIQHRHPGVHKPWGVKSYN